VSDTRKAALDINPGDIIRTTDGDKTVTERASWMAHGDVVISWDGGFDCVPRMAQIATVEEAR
jgi:hypothetical protein